MDTSMMSIGGGDDRIRTGDLLHAKQALSQLSHTPTITNSLHNLGSNRKNIQP
jgi:hypothetical protein